MTKKLLLLALLLSSVSLKAQNRVEPYYGFRLGLKAHPTFGFIKTEKSRGKGEGVSLGFSYGLLGDFNFAENYSFSTGLTITTINGKSTEINVEPFQSASGNAANQTYDVKYKMQYVEIPLTVKLKTDKIGLIKWYGQFGLSNNIAIGRNYDVKRGNTVLADDMNSSDHTSFYRAGLIVGGGVEYDLDQKTSLMFGLTLNNGFTNIVSNKNFADQNNRRVRNHYVGLNIGVFF